MAEGTKPARKRTTRKRATGSARSPKTAATSASAASVSRKTSGTGSVRKAPTRVRAAEQKSNEGTRKLRVVLVAGGAFAVLLASSVMIGLSDGGAINVAATINQRAAAIESEAQANGAPPGSVPTQNPRGVDSRPNSGLRPAGKPAPTPQPALPPASVASTTSTTTKSVNATTTSTVDPDTTTSLATDESLGAAVDSTPNASTTSAE